MHRGFIAAIGALSCSGTMAITLAQATTVQNPGQDSPASTSVVIGCVSREEQRVPTAPGAEATFIVTDKRGSPPLKYRLSGDPEQLRLHIGHTVEISGRVTRSAGAGENASQAAVLPTVKVQSLTYISTTCSK
jgi:hypothetical protein